MNKLFTKIAAAFVGMAMAVGVGVAISNHSGSIKARAISSGTYTIIFGSGEDSSTTVYCTTSPSEEAQNFFSNAISLTGTKNSPNNPPTYNSSSQEVRMYGKAGRDGNSITFAFDGSFSVTQIVVNGSSGYTTGGSYSIDGVAFESCSFSNNIMTLSDLSSTTSFALKNTNDSNTQFRIKSVVFTVSSGSTPQQASVTSVSVDPTSASIYPGDKKQLTKTVVGSGSGYTNVSWISDDEEVVTVDNTGLVTGVAVGTAHVTVRSTVDNSKYATATITVLDYGEILTFTPGTDTGETSVTKGVNSDITVTMTAMNNASYYQIYASNTGSITSNNAKIVKFEITCTANGTSKYGPGNIDTDVGTYTVDGSSATWNGSAKTINTTSASQQVRITSLTVYLEKLPDIQITSNVNTVEKDETIAITTAQDGVTWLSTVPSVATVNASTGVVTGVSVGETVIQGRKTGFNLVQLTIIVTDSSISFVNISISGQTTTLYVNQEFSFGGTVLANYSDGVTTENVTARCSFTGYDMSVAGIYTVTVTYTDESENNTASYTLTVKDFYATEGVLTLNGKYVLGTLIDDANGERTLTGMPGNLGTATEYTDYRIVRYYLTVVKGSTYNSYAFKTVDTAIVDAVEKETYLTATAGNELIKTTSITDLSSWTVSISGNSYIITNVANNRTIQYNYNNGNPRFIAYSTEQTPIRLFELTEELEVGGFIEEFMMMNDSGYSSTDYIGKCDDGGENSPYKKAKAAFNKLSGGARDLFFSQEDGDEYYDAFLRLYYWAKANHEDFDLDGESHAVLSASRGNMISFNNTSSNSSITTVIIIISTLSIISIGGFIFLKKRKEQ